MWNNDFFDQIIPLFYKDDNTIWEYFSNDDTHQSWYSLVRKWENYWYINNLDWEIIHSWFDEKKFTLGKNFAHAIFYPWVIPFNGDLFYFHQYDILKIWKAPYKNDIFKNWVKLNYHGLGIYDDEKNVYLMEESIEYYSSQNDSHNKDIENQYISYDWERKLIWYWMDEDLVSWSKQLNLWFFLLEWIGIKNIKEILSRPKSRSV